MSSNTIIKLQSSDNIEINVGAYFSSSPHPESVSNDGYDGYTAEREVAERSILIKNMMEDIGDQASNDTIPIPNVRLLLQALKDTDIDLEKLG